ncbi:hypothetical protein QCA50_007283 [Cerrena zonata]|uniref:Uncharacterized protein n=1 Tax=Cerrena zonata TaxID=2478898 RepID=A0AAW0GJ47_9APHY
MNPFIATDPELVSLQASLDPYEYIIVGGGFAGGLLAEELASKQKKVLLIERGYPLFSTHTVNTARPSFARGEDDSPEGNEVIYQKLKSWVQLADGSDQDYTGGPLFTLGGRSTVWGLWIPESSKEVINGNFPSQVADDILNKYYAKAFDLVTNNAQQQQVYPQGEINAQELSTAMTQVKTAVQDWIPAGYDLHIGPVASQFNSPSPYRFPQLAFSTVEVLLNHIYARDPYLTVLMGAEVVSLDLSKPNETNKTAKSLTFRSDESKRIHTIPTSNSQVILSAGTIPTAQIALRSGLHLHNPLVGKGLIDHAIYAVRFARESNHTSKDPMLFQTYVDLFSGIEGVGKTRALLSVTINNNFFLAGKSSLPISQYMSGNGTMMSSTDGKQAMSEGTFDTIAILIEFDAELNDDNEVLNVPAPHPVIRLKRHQTHTSEPEQQEMQDLATRVRNIVISDILAPGANSTNSTAVPDDSDPSPRLTLLGAGIYAHEVGTMRMPGPNKTGVVTEDLQVQGFDNLHACDLSVMPHSVEANPSLTLTAITLRFAEHLTGSPVVT